MIRKLLALSLCSTLILSGCGQGTLSNPAGNGNSNTTPPPAPPTPITPQAAIKHVVVIFGENISFDHYFGTYPKRREPRRGNALLASDRCHGSRCDRCRNHKPSSDSGPIWSTTSAPHRCSPRTPT